MKPINTACKMYESVGKDFFTVLRHYVANHYVHCTPECIILAECREDHWFVELAIGKGCLRYFLQLMPTHRPFVVWARGMRNGELRKYKTETLERLL